MAEYRWLHDLLRLYRDAQDGTWAAQRAFRAAVADHADALVLELYDRINEKPKPKPHTIADNYPAGGLCEPTNEEIELHERVEELEAEVERYKAALERLLDASHHSSEMDWYSECGSNPWEDAKNLISDPDALKGGE